MTKSKVAVVIPIYNESALIGELSRRLRAVFAGIPDVDFCVILVNDGSTDHSLGLLLEEHARDPRLTILNLSRNFGHQAAITAGLAHADADAVVIMDGDLQDPPELIGELLSQWRQGGEVVRAQRRSRGERGLRRVGFWLFHRTFSWISDFPIPAESGVFSLLDRQALVALQNMPEKNRFLPGMRAWIGFDQRTVYYDRSDRAAGAPKQTLFRLARYAMDGILSFSYKPLRLMMGAGVFISALGFSLALYFILKRLLDIEPAQTGFTTLVTLVLFLGGIQLIAIGLIGEYLGRVYDEVKQRPMYIVKERHGPAAQPETVRHVAASVDEEPPRLNPSP